MTAPAVSKEEYLDAALPAWIKEHGYDGLYSDECGCLADDLCPCACGSNLTDCRLGYNYGPRETEDGHADFWIGPDKRKRLIESSPSTSGPTSEVEDALAEVENVFHGEFAGCSFWPKYKRMLAVLRRATERRVVSMEWVEERASDIRAENCREDATEGLAETLRELGYAVEEKP